MRAITPPRYVFVPCGQHPTAAELRPFLGAAGRDEPSSEGEAEDKTLRAAIDLAIANVRRFHEAQLPQRLEIETMPGVLCERLSHPLDSVGLYVPAGTAPLPSAAIMLAVPAGTCPVCTLMPMVEPRILN